MEFARFRALLFKVNTFHGVSNSSLYTTMIKSKSPEKKPWRDSMIALYRRIYPIGDPSVSIFPVLDQWFQEGGEVDRLRLRSFIKELRSHKRYSQALQISMWMSDKRYMELTPGDISVRLDLIQKVRSIEEAENYFNNIPKQLRTLEVYAALLNCYARTKSVEKAETVMQKMRDLDLARGSLVYNVLLHLYQQTGQNEKFESLIQEMKEKRIGFDKFTYCTLLKACAANSDTDRIDEIMKEMESGPEGVPGWSVYSTAAKGYREAGHVDKAVAALREAEKLIKSGEKNSEAYEFLITQYSVMGKRDDAMRLWGIYKKKERVLSKGYKIILNSLLKLNDTESAEQVFEEWKSEDRAHDIKIPNFMIRYYSRNGLMEKADSTLKEVISRGEKPNAASWYYASTGYLQEGKIGKAVQAMKEALLVCGTYRLILDKETLAACLRYLKEEENLEEAEEFIGLLQEKGIASSDICQRLLDYIRERERERRIGDDSEVCVEAETK